MAKTLDQRVVEMNFDNRQFEKGVGQSLKTMEELKKGLDFKGASKGLENINASAGRVDLSRIASGVETISSKFSVMGVVAFTILQNITNKALDAGRKIANALIITPITTGFEEYELKIGAIQTIMAGTGESLPVVNDYLNELNTYADKTIYSFSDMTQNIGKFTNAGVSLESSVNAIKGVANVAALSGANSNEASRAMYNFAQALSAGYVKLIDWKSIELANMGTVEFKQQLIDAAVAAGTLTDAGDGMYKTLEGKTLSATKGFNEALTDQWLTSEVLVATLNDYSDVNTDIGKRATAAAQDVKSFTMLLDTLKEALQSGWASSWELILGDFNEAKELFTSLSDRFGDIVGNSADARNKLLSGWKDLGGRTKLIEILNNSLDTLFGLVGMIGDAFREFFPKTTAVQLFIMTKQLAEFVEKIKMAVLNSEGLRKVLRAFFAIIDIGRMFLGSLVKHLWEFVQGFKGAKGPIGDVVAGIADFLINLRDTIKEGEVFDKFFSTAFKILRTVIDGLVIGIGAVVLWLSKIKEIDLGKIGKFFSDLKDKLKKSGKFGEILVAILDAVSGLVKGIGPALSKIGDKLKEFFGRFGDGFKEIFTNVKEWIKEALSSLDFGNLKEMLDKGLLSEILSSLTGFFKEGTKIAAGGVFVLILKSIKDFIDSGGEILGGITGILDGVQDTLKAYQNNLKADTLYKIAGAIALLALAIFGLSLIDSQKLTLATVAIASLFAALIATLETFEKMAGGVKKMGTIVGALFGVSAAILILAGAMIIMSKLNPEQTIQGVAAIGGLLAELAIFVKSVGGGKKMIGVGIGMIALSESIVILSLALLILGKLPADEMKEGLLVLAGALGVLAVATNTFPKNLPVIGAGLLILGLSLLVVARVLKKLGEMDEDVVKGGIGAIAALLIILAGGLHAMTGTIGGAAALLIASGALIALGIALKIIGSIPLKQIGIALLAIVGVFAILGLAGAVLTPVVPVLFALAAAMFLLGISALALGVGVSAFAAGLATMVALGAAGAATLGVIVTTLALLIPLIASQIALGLVVLFTTLANSAPELVDALLTLLNAALDGLSTMIPTVVETVLKLVLTLLEAIGDYLPDIVQAGFDILVGFLDGIADNIGDVVDSGTAIVTEFIDAIGSNAADVVDAGWNTMIDFIDGLADSAEDNIPRMMESLRNLGGAVVNGVLEGIGIGIGDLIAGITNLGNTVIDTFKNVLGIESPSKEMYEQAGYIISGLVKGVKHFSSQAYSAVDEFSVALVKEFNNVTSKISDALSDDIDMEPRITPVIDLTKFKVGAKEISDTIGSKSLDVSMAVRTTGAISNALNQPIGTNQNVVNPKAAAPIQYVQNNYSPKALSRIEIYRQTRNQLRELKGEIA